MSDPLSDTHAAIWTTLELSTAFKAAVPAANRLKLTGQVSGQMDDDGRDSRYPSVRVVPADSDFDAHADSSSSTLVQTWEIQVRSSDERTATVFYPLMWEVLRAMSKAFPVTSAIRSLTWNSKTYNRACKLTRAREAWGRDEPGGTVNRWLCLWRFEVLMEFATADLPPT